MSNTPAASIDALCEEVKQVLPARFSKDSWYLIVAASLVASGQPSALTSLYTYITEEDPGHRGLSYEDERLLKARLGDLLMKEWTLVGIPTVVVAVTALAKAEKEVQERDMKVPEKRINIDNDFIMERGTKFLQKLYKENLSPIFSTWGSYGPDFEWMEKAIIYGLFLSDHELLSPTETSLVTLSSIMCQGLAAPTIWHLRGLRRLGVSEADVELVQRAIEIVAKWAGRDVQGWPRVTDIPDAIKE
ncbi:hypothetical protein MAP00_003422 [Monascus purpureus]|nr:hypothetical protein MAP00_003422 [Monascus purpureus]